MKQAKHENRKSFRKWDMPGQRIETADSEKLNLRRNFREMGAPGNPDNIGKNNGPLKHSVPAKNLSTQFALHKHSCVAEPCGPLAKVIPSPAYAEYLAGQY